MGIQDKILRENQCFETICDMAFVLQKCNKSQKFLLNSLLSSFIIAQHLVLGNFFKIMNS